MTHLCEVCEINELTTTTVNAMGQFAVCEKCLEVVTNVFENEYINSELIPQSVKNEFTNTCGGWTSLDHTLENKNDVIYLKVDSEAPLEEIYEMFGLMQFCRSCLLEYMNDDAVSKNLTIG